MNGSVTLFAPAKVNLTLDVFAPREDGYHDLDSLVAVLARPADELKVTVRPGTRGVRLICKHATLPKDDRNLAVRAANIFLERFLPDAHITVWINLQKRLPVEAGLGGGSSDAAAVFRALNELCPNVASPDALREAAAAVGSDVPAFLIAGESKVVRMRGRGEKVEMILHFPSLYGIIVKPAVGVPTGQAYAALDAIPGRKPGAATGQLLAAAGGGAYGERLAPWLRNDFEAAILPSFPEVAAAHRAVTEAGALRTILCGSGSAVFGLARDHDHSRELARTLVANYSFPFVKIADLPGWEE